MERDEIRRKIVSRPDYAGHNKPRQKWHVVAKLNSDVWHP